LSTLRNPSQYFIPLARTERFKRSFVLYALRSFPTDISEDFCDDLLTHNAICVFCFILNFNNVYTSGISAAKHNKHVFREQSKLVQRVPLQRKD